MAKKKPNRKKVSSAADASAVAVAPTVPAQETLVENKAEKQQPVPQASSLQATSRPASRKPRWPRRIVLILIVLILFAGAGYWYFVIRTGDIVRQNQTLINEVSKLAVVPNDEVPAVTTVVDETKVNQEFLRPAKKGDKVLLYFQAGRAVVYRPSTHQIVNMGPLETPKPRVFLRNGTTEKVLDTVAAKVQSSTDFLLASRDESSKKDYQKTVVIDVTGNRPDVAQRLAKLIGATVIPLPDNESKPDADMMVIVGQDAASLPATSTDQPAIDTDTSPVAETPTP
jgi:hypothetical protein